MTKQDSVSPWKEWTLKYSRWQDIGHGISPDLSYGDYSQKAHRGHVWWCMPDIPALESEEGGSGVQEVTPVHNSLEASLKYMEPCLKGGEDNTHIHTFNFAKCLKLFQKEKVFVLGTQ